MSEHMFNVIARSNLLGGIEVDKMREYIRMLLENKVSKFITTETFDSIYDRIQTLIAERSANIYHQPSLHVAKLICNYPLNVLCEYIKTQNIDGKYLLKENNFSFIQECTGWNKNDTEQIKAVILQHRVKKHSHIYQDLHKESGISDLFMSEIKKVDLEVMQLKNKKGYQIHDEAEHIMDSIQECQNKQNKENESFVVDIYDKLSKCIVSSGNWICYNCSNENFNAYEDDEKKKEISGICSLCGVNILGSIN
eukprot:384349_1